LVYGRTFDFNAVLPEIRLADFIKSVAFQFGCIFQTNSLTQTVTIKSFDTITDNKSAAIDWSNKVDFIEPPSIYYRLDEYAQVNKFLYKEDDNVIEEIGRGEILIADSVLDPEAEIIVLEFAASNNSRYFTFNQSLAICKVWSGDESSPVVFEKDVGVETRVVRAVTSSGNNVDFVDPSGTTSVSNVVVGQFDTELSWDSLLTNYWGTIKAILEGKVKRLELFIRLSELDIQGLDFFKPIYLNTSDPRTGLAINGYFYIEEVKEYQAGKSTEVVLVKLA
jgi:hypothetical protein